MDHATKVFEAVQDIDVLATLFHLASHQTPTFLSWARSPEIPKASPPRAVLRELSPDSPLSIDYCIVGKNKISDLDVADRCSTMTLVHNSAQYPVHTSIEK